MTDKPRHPTPTEQAAIDYGAHAKRGRLGAPDKQQPAQRHALRFRLEQCAASLEEDNWAGAGALMREAANALDEQAAKIAVVAEDRANYQYKIAKLRGQNAALREALGKIAAGDGIYGAQAHEYKQIARAAQAKRQAQVWWTVADKLDDAQLKSAGDRATQISTLATFARLVAEAYEESDNARG